MRGQTSHSGSQQEARSASTDTQRKTRTELQKGTPTASPQACVRPERTAARSQECTYQGPKIRPPSSQEQCARGMGASTPGHHENQQNPIYDDDIQAHQVRDERKAAQHEKGDVGATRPKRQSRLHEVMVQDHTNILMDGTWSSSSNTVLPVTFVRPFSVKLDEK
jgi:hypothetical protein